MRAMAAGEVPLLVATVEGLLQRTLPPEELDRAWRGAADRGEL